MSVEAPDGTGHGGSLEVLLEVELGQRRGGGLEDGPHNVARDGGTAHHRLPAPLNPDSQANRHRHQPS